MHMLKASVTAISLLALGACTTTPSATTVRFHQDLSTQRGTIILRPADMSQLNSLEFRAQARAVAQQLEANGFQIVPATSPATFGAVIQVTTTERAAPPKSSGVSVGLGGGFSTGGVGLGSSVSFPLGKKTAPSMAITTTLSVTIVQQPSNQPLWEGRSSLDSYSDGQHGTALAPALAKSLFTGFPGPSGKTVAVPITK